jgi:hypothetical protein
MRFELIGKTKATIQDVDVQSLKMGQTDVKPAVCITLKVSLPNKSLDMLGPKVREFFYENTGKSTGQLAGIAAISDLPNLTAAALAIGAVTWEYEQTGCTLLIYIGATGRANIKLTDGTTRKLKFECKEGGTVDWSIPFFTAEDIDAEIMGDVGVLKSLERDVELTAPDIISNNKQRTLSEEDEGDQLTPIGALAGAEQKANGAADKKDEPMWPFPTEAPAGAGVKVTTKPASKAVSKTAH